MPSQPAGTAATDGGVDPGLAASSEPERAVEPAVRAVGVGPGGGFLTDRGRAVLSEADVVVGFETVVDVVREVTDATLLSCGYDDQGETLSAFAGRVSGGAEGAAVLMGDPNVSGYQFLGRVERAVDGPVSIVPGVSSVQVAASRARTPIEQATVVSLHRRGPVDAELDRLADDAGQRHLLVLPRPYDLMPEDVASHLLAAGADPSLSALVCERLTRTDESITRTTVGELARDGGCERGSREETRFSDLSVLVVRAPRSPDTSGSATEGRA